MSEKKSPNSTDNRKWMYLGAIGLTLITKYKTLIPLLSKLAVPVFSMLASIAAYAWATKSWEIAIGFVVLLLIHEMGHVWAAKLRGLPVSMPVFIPFLGALITMKKHPRDALTEAYVAIGGPILGSVGAFAAYLLGVALDSPTLVVVAYTGFFINLINLLPIHPLDGGRIATAVTRWLWLVGLIGGLFVILYLGSILFMIIWGLFAFELFSKYVGKRSKRARKIPFQIQIPIEYLRMQGVFVPGEQHQKTLEFVTYSSREGMQTIEVYWDSIGVREKVQLQNPFIVKTVKVARIKHVQDENGGLTHIVAHCEIEGVPYENDRYFDVPTSARWGFGAAYLGLAGILALMMLSIHSMNLPGV